MSVYSLSFIPCPSSSYFLIGCEELSSYETSVSEELSCSETSFGDHSSESFTRAKNFECSGQFKTKTEADHFKFDTESSFISPFCQDNMQTLLGSETSKLHGNYNVSTPTDDWNQSLKDACPSSSYLLKRPEELSSYETSLRDHCLSAGSYSSVRAKNFESSGFYKNKREANYSRVETESSLEKPFYQNESQITFGFEASKPLENYEVSTPTDDRNHAKSSWSTVPKLDRRYSTSSTVSGSDIPLHFTPSDSNPHKSVYQEVNHLSKYFSKSEVKFFY